MKQGKVKFFDTDRGFGFIKENDSEKEHFVHVSGVNETTLNENDDVEFELVEGKKGMNAVNVSII